MIVTPSETTPVKSSSGESTLLRLVREKGVLPIEATTDAAKPAVKPATENVITKPNKKPVNVESTPLVPDYDQNEYEALLLKQRQNRATFDDEKKIEEIRSRLIKTRN